MPEFDYQCACGHVVTIKGLVKGMVCLECGGKMQRMWHSVVAHHPWKVRDAIAETGKVPDDTGARYASKNH